jgi:hypothetical protein
MGKRFFETNPCQLQKNWSEVVPQFRTAH